MQPAVPVVPAVRTWRSYSCLRTFKFFPILSIVFLLSIAVHAQTDFTRIYGAEDQTVPMPTFVGALGQKDAGALQELIDFVKAVNITAWQGMQATGTLTDMSGNANPATLTILNGDQYRLDVQTPNGQRSTRVSGGYGKTLEVDGKSFPMPPATAKAGLLAFPRLLVSRVLCGRLGPLPAPGLAGDGTYAHDLQRLRGGHLHFTALRRWLLL